MKVVLVNPPNGFRDHKYLAPPVGLLTLASVIRKYDHDVAILDFNLEVLSDPSIGNEGFYDIACKIIADEKADALAFTSMCLESHVSLELARRVKAAMPHVATIFGGTHFGAIAKDTLENFLFADYVVSGEGEYAIVTVLDRLSGNKRVLPNNVLYREEGRVVAGVTEQKRGVLDELPFPAYDLVDLHRYFSLNPDRLLNYEAGRGCVFKCSFCYSPFQYGDAVRNKATDRVVEDLQHLSELGARHIFFVQDNLLNSPRWAAELSRKIADANLPLTWECYATYPQLSDQLIDLLAKAGCVGVFTGIDAVTPESQVRMNKPFLKSWETASRKLSYCREKGILPICAFILEGPTQPTDKIDSTILTALECMKLGCEIHVNTLTLYNSTTLAASTITPEWFYSQIKPELLFDTPKVVQDNPLARKFPRLFPYHSTYFEVEAWEIFTVKVFTLLAALIAVHKALYKYGVAEENSIWNLLRYVDNRSVERIRQTSVTRRRLEALLLFAEHYLQLPLSLQSRRLFRRELAQLILSSYETPRFVSLRVGDSVSEYVLGWFVCTSEGFMPDHDIAIEMMLESHLAFGAILPHSTVSSLEPHEVALRSHNDWITFYVVDEERLVLLSALIRASKSGTFLSLSSEHVLQLTEEEWIWPAGMGESPHSRLGTCAVAA